MATGLDVQTMTLGDGLTVGYRELGSGPPVLLLHGWPTSSFLWRRVMPLLAERNRVVALDLPGFGASDKPVDVRYGFDLFEQAIEGALDRLGIDEVALVGHDLGGSVAVHWALRQPTRVTRLALLNTLLYPEMPDTVMDFVATLRSDTDRHRLTSDQGLAEVMRTGVADEGVVTEEVLAGVQGPFRSDADRLALAHAGIGLSIKGFAEIADGLPSLRMPVRVVYGEQDRLLPGVADTMARLAEDVARIEVTALADVGHFLQEEDPVQVADLLATFFASPGLIPGSTMSTDPSSNEPTPKPSAALRALDRLAGTWTLSGDTAGTATYEWMEGRFFLLQSFDFEHEGRRVLGLEVIGHERPFGGEPGADIRSRAYDSAGNTLDYVYELEGDVLTIWGGERGSPAHYRGTFSADGHCVTGEWVYPGGGYESSMTKATFEHRSGPVSGERTQAHRAEPDDER